MGKITNIAKKNDLPPGKAIAVDVDNNRIAVFNINGSYYAIEDTCTHAGGSLSEGELEGTVVTCPWHGATFDVQSGAALSAPAYDGVKSFKVTLEGDDIKIET